MPDMAQPRRPLPLLLLLPLLLVVGVVAEGAAALDVRSAEVAAASEVALRELRKASDSGIFETLEIAAVRSAAAREGRFHRVLELEVDLHSPHLEISPVTTEIVVLKDPAEDGAIRSVAVEDLPSFPEAVVEEFRRMKVRDAAARREEAFAEMERDYLAAQRLTAELASAAASSGDQASASPRRETLAGLRTKALLDMKALPGTSAQIASVIDEIVQERLDRLLEVEALAQGL